MEEFWNQSWDHADMNRVSEYIEHIKSSEPLSDSILDCLKKQQAKVVCDAGCGCGAYSLKLALNGFKVFGFDISAAAVRLSKELLSSRNIEHGDFLACDILATGFEDNQFDAVVSRDVIDHMPLMNGIAAIRELYRIVKKGGSIVITLDQSDAEYETEPHIVNSDGDYIFTGGKWNGMVFHPYSENEVSRLVQVGTIAELESAADGFLVVIVKQEDLNGHL